ncbi:hypothetical protein LX32DRAFT_436222 [Colletotrichum zoysiae]|uniref:Secreted protein n=1 Tax=Colletotrichum zoysiae TaxID=1216348 RepID=A0AAD9HF21_9PEZI|nr:hypothetical protein LX32DRAFT_436222 [Colletotrichum zoysiae]
MASWICPRWLLGHRSLAPATATWSLACALHYSKKMRQELVTRSFPTLEPAHGNRGVYGKLSRAPCSTLHCTLLPLGGGRPFTVASSPAGVGPIAVVSCRLPLQPAVTRMTVSVDTYFVCTHIPTRPAPTSSQSVSRTVAQIARTAWDFNRAIRRW